MDEVVIKPFSPASQATIVEEGELPKMIIDVDADDVGYPIKSGYEPEFEEIDISASKPRPVVVTVLRDHTFILTATSIDSGKS